MVETNLVEGIKDFYRNHAFLSILLLLSLVMVLLVPFLFKSFFISLIIVILLSVFVFKDFVGKHKFLSLVLSAFLVFILSFFIAWGIKWFHVSLMSAPVERHYVSYMTGVVDPFAQVLLTPEDISRMREDNINTITVYPSTYLSSDFSFLYELEKPYLVGVIKEAKRQGLAVRVSGQSGDPAPSEDCVTDDYLDLISARVLDWASISEDLGVEYFSPWTEVDAIGFNRAVEWHDEILPSVRKRFSGRVFAGWTCCASDDVFTPDFLPAGHDEEDVGEAYGWHVGFVRRVNASRDFDGVMLDLPIGHVQEWQAKYFWNSSLPLQEGDDWRPDSLESIVIDTSRRADELGIPIFVGEFYVQTKEGGGAKESMPVYGLEEQARVYEKFLDIVMPYYDGVIHCFWSNPLDAGIKNTPAEEVIREKYGEYAE